MGLQSGALHCGSLEFRALQFLSLQNESFQYGGQYHGGLRSWGLHAEGVNSAGLHAVALPSAGRAICGDTLSVLTTYIQQFNMLAAYNWRAYIFLSHNLGAFVWEILVWRFTHCGILCMYIRLPTF